MTADQLATFILDHAMNPAVLVLAIVFATFLLEDAATVAIGLLAAQMRIDPGMALTALVVGTVIGDLGLHFVGRFAGSTRWAARLKAQPRVRRIEGWLQTRSVLALAAARFLPGFRLPTFVASGFLHLPVWRTTAVITAVTLVWTPGLFFLAQGAAELGPAAWAAGGSLLLLALFGPQIVRRLRPVAP